MDPGPRPDHGWEGESGRPLENPTLSREAFCMACLVLGLVVSQQLKFSINLVRRHVRSQTIQFV